MVQSLNTKVDLTIDGSSFLGINSYGKVMIGDNAFEYYNSRNVSDYIQIPWTEIDSIYAQVFFNKFITRFVIITKGNLKLSFSTRDNKKTLRAVSKYISKDKMYKSDTFFKVILRGIKKIFGK